MTDLTAAVEDVDSFALSLATMWHTMRCAAWREPTSLALSDNWHDRRGGLHCRDLFIICQRHVLRNVVSQLRDRHAWL